MKLYAWPAVVVLGLIIGCMSRGPVIDTGNRPAGIGGTLAGSVSASDEKTPLSGRKVTAVETTTQKRFETSTATNGAFSLKVPTGTYRLEVELRPGEVLASQPDVTDVSDGDIDEGRNFVVSR